MNKDHPLHTVKLLLEAPNKLLALCTQLYFSWEIMWINTQFQLCNMDGPDVICFDSFHSPAILFPEKIAKQKKKEEEKAKRKRMAESEDEESEEESEEEESEDDEPPPKR